MIPLSSAVSSGLTFTSSFRGYELKQNNQVVATLKRPSLWSSQYVASATNANWRLHRTGFWGCGVEIIDSASQQPIATFKSVWGGKGTLTFADGQKFLVVSQGCWRPVWHVTTESGQAVLQVRQREKRVEVANATVVPEGRRSLLIMFALYRMRQAEEAAGAAVIAAS